PETVPSPREIENRPGESDISRALYRDSSPESYRHNSAAISLRSQQVFSPGTAGNDPLPSANLEVFRACSAAASATNTCLRACDKCHFPFQTCVNKQFRAPHATAAQNQGTETWPTRMLSQ